MHKDEGYQEFKKECELTRHEELVGFYHTPMFPSIYVSRDGRVYDDFRKKHLWVHIGKKGYPTVRIAGKNTYLHRLLCSTFIAEPNLGVKLHVNHRDGNKKNFSLSNLEWATPSQNCTHAYENGLRGDNRHVLLKDIVTGEVKEFVSIGACARYLGKGPSSPFRYLSVKPRAPYLGRYDLVRKGWSFNGFTVQDFGKVFKELTRSITAIDARTGDVVIYGSANQASRALGISRKDISKQASTNEKEAKNGYRFVWTDTILGKGQ